MSPTALTTTVLVITLLNQVKLNHRAQLMIQFLRLSKNKRRELFLIPSTTLTSNTTDFPLSLMSS